jgi:hypothetical protein
VQARSAAPKLPLKQNVPFYFPGVQSYGEPEVLYSFQPEEFVARMFAENETANEK